MSKVLFTELGEFPKDKLKFSGILINTVHIYAAIIGTLKESRV